MNLITVVPITRQKVPPTLSYFTSRDVPVGAVVSVPLRTKLIHAIVTESRPADDLKAELRAAPYEIRKLGNVKAAAFFSAAFMDACRTLADFYATTVGAVVGSIVSETILENAQRIQPPLPLQPSFLGGAPVPDETYAVQGDAADRLSSWKSLIRQQFARKKSVAIYVPSAEDARQLYASLEKGIEGYIFMLHGSLPKKRMLETWSKIAETDHPTVVVATPAFAVLPRGDIESVVIERENGRGWIGMKAPYLDLRHALETIGRREHRTVYLSDSLLRAETLCRMDERDVAEGTPFKWRSISTSADILVDMRREAGRSDAGGAPFRAIGDELLALIRTNREENTNLFIMTSRRGLATVTVCDDCETLVSCGKCGAPAVLHASARPDGANYFLCHVCGERMDADRPCATCGGHRLSPLGVGTERIRDEIKAALPDVEMFHVDMDTTTTEKQISERIERWRSRPGSVLIGTEMALMHISGTVDHVAVASVDSMLALPDFRIEERLMYMLLRLRSIATRTVLVQTRRADNRIFEYGLKGNLSDFYRSVIAERKRFDYPPFSLLVKITLEGRKEDIARQMGELQAHLAPHEIDVFPAYTATSRGKSQIHGLMKIERRHWPEPELVGKLRSMPPEVSVKINPESLL